MEPDKSRLNTKIEPHNEGSKKLNVKDGNFATLVANGRLANFVQVPKHSGLKSNKKFVEDGNFATLVANGRLVNFVQVPKLRG